jgi:hypothetical protein
MTNQGSPKPPVDLSRRAKDVWRELMASHDFAAHEQLAVSRALTWFDQSDALRREAEALRGRERGGMVAALDVSEVRSDLPRQRSAPSLRPVRRMKIDRAGVYELPAAAYHATR